MSLILCTLYSTVTVSVQYMCTLLPPRQPQRYLRRPSQSLSTLVLLRPKSIFLKFGIYIISVSGMGQKFEKDTYFWDISYIFIINVKKYWIILLEGPCHWTKKFHISKISIFWTIYIGFKFHWSPTLCLNSWLSWNYQSKGIWKMVS